MNMWRRPSPKTVRLAFVAGGGLFLIVGVWLLIDAAVFLRDANTVRGTVSEMVEAGEGRQSPKVEFTVDAKRISFTSRVSSNPPNFVVGEDVRVVYRPEDPTRARIDSFGELWLIPMGRLCSGACSLRWESWFPSFSVRDQAEQ